MVTDAPVGGVTDGGLTRQPAFWFGGAGVISQLSATEPLNPLSGEIVRLDELLPLGSTATGLKGAICRLKSVCAAAAVASANSSATEISMRLPPKRAVIISTRHIRAQDFVSQPFFNV